MIRAESEIKFSTYFNQLPSSDKIRQIHDRVTLAIMDVLEEMTVPRSHIAARCRVGYEFATFYGTEGEEAFSLEREDDDDDYDEDDGA